MDVHMLGTRVEPSPASSLSAESGELEAEAEVDMLEVDSSVEPRTEGAAEGQGPPRPRLGRRLRFFAASAPFATMHPHLSYDEARAHCKASSGRLCKSTELCTGGSPVGGARDQQAWLPVGDADNAWLSVSGVRTCEVRSDPAWGKNGVYKTFKGLVACCNELGDVQAASLSRWEGFLIKAEGASSVFMVESGLRRVVPSGTAFEAMGFQVPRIKTLPAEEVSAIPLGASLPDHSGREKNSELFDHAVLGYDHEGGTPFELYEGYLVKKASQPQTCMVENASARCVPDTDTFEALGFEYRLVYTIDGPLFDAFPRGAPFESRRGAAPNSEPYSHPLLGRDHHGTSTLKHTEVGTSLFLDSAIRRVLDREPLPNERTLYLQTLREKRDVRRLVRKLATSNGFQTKHVYPLIVHSLYRQLLERDPTPAESTELITQFRITKHSGDPTKNVKQVVSRLMNSEEFGKRFLTKEGVTPDHAVRALLRRALGKEGEEAHVKELVAAQAEGGWALAITELLDSHEYKSVVGVHGVPGDRTLYSPAVRTAFKKLVNLEGDALTQTRVDQEAHQVAREGWSAWVSDFVRETEYANENGDRGFLDERDRTITLRPRPPVSEADRRQKEKDDQTEVEEEGEKKEAPKGDADSDAPKSDEPAAEQAPAPAADA